MAKSQKKTSPSKPRGAKSAGEPAAPSQGNGKGTDGVAPQHWNLRLYVAGQTPKSITAFANLKRLCEQHLPGRYEIEVIDLIANPQLAAGDQILAVPTLVRKLPSPLKKVIGNLSDEERFLIGLDLKSSANPYT